ncbi:MAG: hypothetical protein V4594_04870 [Bacteroidota bacterium]
METNNQSELQEEEISNPEQFQVGRIPSEDENDLQNSNEDDDVELGFINEEDLQADDETDSDLDDDTDSDLDDDLEGEPGDEDADFENPDDDPA